MSSTHIEFVIILFTINVVLICLIAYIVRQTLQIKKYYLQRLEEKNRNNVLWIEHKESLKGDVIDSSTNDKTLKNSDEKLTTFVPRTTIPSFNNNKNNTKNNTEGERLYFRRVPEVTFTLKKNNTEMNEEFYSEVPAINQNEIYDIPPSVDDDNHHEYSVPPEIDSLPLPPIPPKPKKILK